MGGGYSIIATPQWFLTGIWSFGRSGFERASRSWDPESLNVDLTGKVHIVTGANSGLGRYTAEELARRNATVHLLCRDAERGKLALDEIQAVTGNQFVHLHVVDLSKSSDVKRFAEEFVHSGSPLDVLVNNAGLMPPERQITEDGLELCFGTMLLQTYLLTTLLLPSMRLSSSSRVINISSGGMYPVRLNPDNLNSEHGRYDGTFAYAHTKRAQIVLTELMAEKLDGSGITINSMHPGWSDTPGLQKAMPSFHSSQSSMLRTTAQGADTIIWMAIAQDPLLQSSGLFFFDRCPVRTHMSFSWTQEDRKSVV